MSRTSSQTWSTQARGSGSSSRRTASPIKRSLGSRAAQTGSSGSGQFGSKDRPINICSSDTEDEAAPSRTNKRIVVLDDSDDDDDEDDDWASAVASIRSVSPGPQSTSSILSVSPRVVNPFASREARDAWHRSRLEAQGEVVVRTEVVVSEDEHPTSDEESTIRDQTIAPVGEGYGILLDGGDSVLPGLFQYSPVPPPPLRYGFGEDASPIEDIAPVPSPVWSQLHIGSELGTDTRQSVGPEHDMDHQDESVSRPSTPPFPPDDEALEQPANRDSANVFAAASLPIPTLGDLASLTPGKSAVPAPSILIAPLAVQSRTHHSVRISPSPDLLMDDLPSDEGDSRPPTPPLPPNGLIPSPERFDRSVGDTPPVRDEQVFGSLKRGFPSVSQADSVERQAKRSLVGISGSNAPLPARRVLSLVERIAMADQTNPRPLDEHPQNVPVDLGTLQALRDRLKRFGPATDTASDGLPSQLDFIPRLRDPSPALELSQELTMDAEDPVDVDPMMDHQPVEELAPYVDSSTQTSPPPPELPWPIIAQHRDTLEVASPLVRMLLDELSENQSKCMTDWEIAFAHGTMPFKADLRALVVSLGATLLEIEDEHLTKSYSGDVVASRDILQGDSPRLIVFPSGTRDIEYELFARHKDTSHVDVVKFLDLAVQARRHERETAKALQMEAALKAKVKAKVKSPPKAPASLVARLESKIKPPRPQPSIRLVDTQTGQSEQRSSLLERMEAGPAPRSNNTLLANRGRSLLSSSSTPPLHASPLVTPTTGNHKPKPLHERMI